MRAFVTGATGLLGNNLARTLLHEGHEVLALARSKDKAVRQLGDTGARIVVGDMADVAGFADALSNVDVVFHTAAFFRDYYTPGDHAAVIDRINVDATMELARTARLKGVRKMVHTGSSGLIGHEPDGSAGDEDTPAWPGIERNLYLKSKERVESQLLEFAWEQSFFIAHVLPAWMWGPHDAGPTASGQLVRDALAGRLPPAIPPGGSSVVDARDVARTMLKIVEVGRTGQRYIVSSGYVELAEVVERLAELTGRRAPRMRMPYPLALTLAAAMEGWSRLTGQANVMSVQGIRLMNARLAAKPAKAERELGIRCRPFEETLADTVAWTHTGLRHDAASIDYSRKAVDTR